VPNVGKGKIVGREWTHDNETVGKWTRSKWRQELIRELGGAEVVTRSQKMLVRDAINQMTYLSQIDRELLRLPSVVNGKPGRVQGLINDRMRVSEELRAILWHLGLARGGFAKRMPGESDNTPDLSELLTAAVAEPASITNAAKRSGLAQRTEAESTSATTTVAAVEAESVAEIAAGPILDAKTFDRAHGLDPWENSEELGAGIGSAIKASE
jgi:hypothetical protein